MQKAKSCRWEDLWRMVVEEKYFGAFFSVFFLRFIVGPPPPVEFMQMKWFVFHICNICTQIRSGKESKEVIRSSGPLDLYTDAAVEISEEPLKAGEFMDFRCYFVLC